MVGRVLSSLPGESGIRYYVRFPNRTDALMGEEQIETRCLAPVGDPAGVLGAGGAESQFLFDRRQEAVRLMVRGRASSRGLAGLLSASVKLLPHQLEVVRQITEDPVQRYLLADEVGLGKTIEACAVIRQTLLDSPDRTVLVLAPAPLVSQWTGELEGRFGIDEFGGQVEVDSHDRLAEPPQEWPEILVVDEVHRLVADYERSAVYPRLVEYSRHADRLLLLSATPVLNEARATLALLHLLDPAGYRLDDVRGFEQRLDIRQQLGRTMLLLSSDTSAFVAKRAAAAVRDTIPGDNIACEFSDQLLTAARSGSSASIAGARAELKEYLSDAYRINRRLLRTRRRDIQGLGLLARNSEVTIEITDQDDLAQLADAIEDWRYSATSRTGPEDRVQIADRYTRLAHAFGTSVTSLREEGERQRREIDSKHGATFPEDVELLERIRSLATDDINARCADYAAAVIRYALNGIERRGIKAAKLVAFSSSTSFARLVTDCLPKHIGYGAAFLVDSSTTRETIAQVLHAFHTLARPGVLICDRAGEEGLNLQFVDALLHLDLPYEFMRVEQRIGRLDRIGRTQPRLPQRVVLPTEGDGDPWFGWAALLQSGFRVFDESVSDLQFIADDLVASLKLRLFETGRFGQNELDLVRDQLKVERQRLDEQYALDRVELADAEAEETTARLMALDADDHALSEAFDGWWREALQLARDRSGESPDVFTLVWTERTLVPVEPWYERVASSLDRPLTFDRHLASETRSAALVRSGRSIVDALPSLLRHDDRGTSFATWRCVPEWVDVHGEWIILRLGFVVEVDLETAFTGRPERVGSRDAVRRRIDALMPPWLETVYLDSDLRPVSDPELIRLLELPYDDDAPAAGRPSRRDFNLASRPKALASRLAADELDDLSLAGAARARDLLTAREAYRERVTDRVAAAAVAISLLEQRLERREHANRLQDVSEPSIGRERQLLRMLSSLCTQVAPRLDSAGLFIVAAAPPEES